MPDRYRRKRVRNMRRVLREHGSPVPRDGCLPLSLIVAGLLALVLLVGCGPKTTLHSGDVVAKDYDAARDWTSHYCASHDPKTFICTLWMPEYHHEPERFRIQIQGYDDGDLVTQWKTVSEHTWNTLQEGDHWSDGSDDA